MLKNTQKGFTLIELLVVIAIIGILASVVLASLNTARTKGADAAVKASLNNARAQAELFYDPNGTYDNVCTTGTNNISAMVSGAKAQSHSTAGSPAHDAAGATDATTCNDTAAGWAAEVPLKSGDGTATTGLFWCVDSTGASKQETGTSLSGATDVTCI